MFSISLTNRSNVGGRHEALLIVVGSGQPNGALVEAAVLQPPEVPNHQRLLRRPSPPVVEADRPPIVQPVDVQEKVRAD